MTTLLRQPLAIALSLVLAACAAPAQTPSTGDVPREQQPPSAPKRVVIAAQGDAQVFYFDMQVTLPSDDHLEELVNRGLSEADPTGVFRPVMAETMPSIDAGSWKLLADGRMETTWRIKPNARWQDGAPYTSADVAFTMKAAMDPELPLRQRPVYASIDRVEAPDPLTVTVIWSRPFIDADSFFSRELVLPLPRHLLEKAVTEDKASFANLPYWTDEFIGTGPFRVREFEAGSRIVLQANDLYVLGRPNVDEIEIAIIPDPNAQMAAVLAGTVDLVLGRGVNADRASVLEEQWKEGRVDTRISGSTVIYTQFMGASPAGVTDVQFRRALLMGIDRQQIADVLVEGRTPVAHMFIGPNEPEYKDIENAVVRYDYDPRRAAQLIEGLGHRKGPDGLLRDGANQRLAIEVRSDPGETEQKSSLAVADAWRQLGVDVDTVVIPTQRARDLEYLFTYPAFQLRGHSSRIRSGFLNYSSKESPLPENRWAGGNRGRYSNPELDVAIDRYFVTIPRTERTQVLQTAVRIISDQIPVLTLFYTPQFAVIANRVENMQPSKASGTSSKTWDAQAWDVRR
ncbi:MAG: hypothetical protein HW416_549 [Chloroflexi bacterium]|nr:hypothetical protein [Chloroflexota bacterium]